MYIIMTIPTKSARQSSRIGRDRGKGRGQYTVSSNQTSAGYVQYLHIPEMGEEILYKLSIKILTGEQFVSIMM